MVAKKNKMSKLNNNPIINTFITWDVKKREYSREIQSKLQRFRKKINQKSHPYFLICRLCESKIPLYKYLVFLIARVGAYGALYKAHGIYENVS